MVLWIVHRMKYMLPSCVQLGVCPLLGKTGFDFLEPSRLALPLGRLS